MIGEKGAINAVNTTEEFRNRILMISLHFATSNIV